MSALAIRVTNLGKLYHIGSAQARYKTLRESLVQAVASPVQRATRLLRGNSAVGDDRDRTIWALKDVSFEIHPGEVVGIIGRNGAGKSTLLKILSRITEPTEGSVDLYGRVGSLLEVGTGFHPELSGRENVYLNGAILGMKKVEIERKLTDIVDFAEINTYIDTPVKHYSSGMYMRLAFAVAAHLETEILLVDEVLAVGDAQFQKKCLGKMGQLAHEGRTVLFVSHNMNAIEQLCGNAMLLDRGIIQRFSSDVRSLTTEYLFGLQDEALNPNIWVNTRGEFTNPWFTPLRFFLSDLTGNPLPKQVSNDSYIGIQIEAQIERVDPALTVGYAIYTESGVLLYWSYQTDQPEGAWPQLHTGICILHGYIPSRLLNEGTYKIELIGGLHFREWLFEPGIQAPSIYLTIHGGLSTSPYWMVKRSGELAPVIEWVLIKPKAPDEKDS